MPGSISGHDKIIYHLLCRAFGQCISISEVIDLDIFDVITICNVHITVDIAGT
jgi:hypothetical protein